MGTNRSVAVLLNFTIDAHARDNARMTKLIGSLLALALLPSTFVIFADTGRSHANGDTSRKTYTTDTRRHSKGSGESPGSGPQMVDPGPRQFTDRVPKYGYWSTKCVKQRGSSFSPWNHSKDCDHPAYSGGYRPRPYGPPYGFGPPIIIINDYNGARYRR